MRCASPRQRRLQRLQHVSRGLFELRHSLGPSTQMTQRLSVPRSRDGVLGVSVDGQAKQRERGGRVLFLEGSEALLDVGGQNTAPQFERKFEGFPQLRECCF